MPFNSRKHHRRSIRLKGYDYAQAGLYFVTICIQNRADLFGHIHNGEMILNDAGRMVEHWYYELENKFGDIKCGEMIVMPNHFHCILKNTGVGVGVDVGADVGANLCVRPNPNNPPPKPPTQPADGGLESAGGTNGNRGVGEPPGSGLDGLGEHIGSPLRRVVQWFKTMTTNEYIRGVKTLGWPRFAGKLWQRDYWEHIIRNEIVHQRIAEYIKANPQKWHTDRLNNEAGNNNLTEPDTPYNTPPWMV